MSTFNMTDVFNKIFTVGSSEADGALLLPDELEQSLVRLALLRGLDAAARAEGEVLVLHGPQVPLATAGLVLQLEGLVVRDLLLVGRHVHPCGGDDEGCNEIKDVFTLS